MATLVLPPEIQPDTIARLEEVARERIHQIKTQASPAQDDAQASGHWFYLLAARVDGFHTGFRADPQIRRNMIELAAIAIAIVESIDRSA